MQQLYLASPERTDALASFLHAHLGRIHSGDVGALIGQAASIREFGAASVAPWRTIQLALDAGLSDDTGEPPRDQAGPGAFA